MIQLDTDHSRRVSNNAAGKRFKPTRFGHKPIPSAQFSYDHNQCKAWFDRWLYRGGSIMRDAVYFKRANDMPDRRNFEDKLIWAKIGSRLYAARALVRRSALVAEVNRARGKVVPIKR